MTVKQILTLETIYLGHLYKIPNSEQELLNK